MSAQDLEQRARELLPELPPMAMTIAGNAPDAGHWYRAEQMRDYATSAIVAALRQQPAPVVDDARMARALEWVRTAARGNVGEGDALRAALIESARKHLPAIEEAIAAYDPNCGARTVRVVDDAMVRRVWELYWRAEKSGDVTVTEKEMHAIANLIARAQGVQS